jgi:hypothetical protein
MSTLYSRQQTRASEVKAVTAQRYDVIFALKRTPEPLINYLVSRLAALELDVVRLSGGEGKSTDTTTFLCVTVTGSVLEPLAEQFQLQKMLNSAAEGKWSETDYRVRTFTRADRASFMNAGVVEFSPTERAFLLQSCLETRLVAEEAWPAALAAAGCSGAADHPKAAWLLGPNSNSNWDGQLPLIGALTELVLGISPHMHGNVAFRGIPTQQSGCHCTGVAHPMHHADALDVNNSTGQVSRPFLVALTQW